MADFDDGAAQRPVPRLGASLDVLAASCSELEGIARESLSWGDRIVVATRNSTYTLWSLSAGGFVASGGWFDRRAGGRAVVAVNGCTWGGSAIRANLVAAPGFFLEFANGVRTSRIRTVAHVPADWRGLVH